MKTFKRFTSFEDLKAIEDKSSVAKINLEKHRKFEKVLNEINFLKIQQVDKKSNSQYGG